eukprot:scaffold28968_cov120-Isochrysis_galbana.AAC.7
MGWVERLVGNIVGSAECSVVGGVVVVRLLSCRAVRRRRARSARVRVAVARRRLLSPTLHSAMALFARSPRLTAYAPPVRLNAADDGFRCVRTAQRLRLEGAQCSVDSLQSVKRSLAQRSALSRASLTLIGLGP